MYSEIIIDMKYAMNFSVAVRNDKELTKDR